ncbi:MAG TPA: DNA recombination protein RmuC [bacterium]|nr:DNA recombination protein RmuC [bacterium]
MEALWILVGVAVGFAAGWFIAVRVATARATAEKEAAQNLMAVKESFFTQQIADLKAQHAAALAEMRDAFKALSVDALKEQAPEFLRLAGENFGKLQATAQGDLAKRQEAIAGMLKPLEEQLKIYQQRLQQSEKDQATTLGEVKKQLETIGRQSETLTEVTQKFRMVLSSSQARGKWGEETLRRVVEAAGMSAHCDFVEQMSGDEARPDLIIRLPGERVIIVDAKVPDLDFLSALDVADAAQRNEALIRHAKKLRDTVKGLADRGYPAKFANSLDHVVLFMPAESLFSAALEADRDLIVWAAERKILLATPASLIALLRSVSISWQQAQQAENAQLISRTAQELYERITVFTEHFDKIGKALAAANDAFGKAAGSYEKRVRPQGERLLELGVAPRGDKRLADLSAAVSPDGTRDGTRDG